MKSFIKQYYTDIEQAMKNIQATDSDGNDLGFEKAVKIKSMILNGD